MIIFIKHTYVEVHQKVCYSDIIIFQLRDYNILNDYYNYIQNKERVRAREREGWRREGRGNEPTFVMRSLVVAAILISHVVTVFVSGRKYSYSSRGTTSDKQ